MTSMSTSERSGQWRESRDREKELGAHQSGEATVQDHIQIESRRDLSLFRRAMVYVSTIARLGIANVLRVLFHRACKRSGIYCRLLPNASTALEFHIHSSCDPQSRLPLVDRAVLTEADELLTGRVTYFSTHPLDVGNPPDWFLNPFQNIRHTQSTAHWSKIADFDRNVGDIKIIWEPSRFTWATVFARAWRMSGDSRYPSGLQRWMEDWWTHNPPYTGPNWMCGQETSIRLINTLLAFKIAGLESAVGAGIATFVESHCRRIGLTTSYAVAQDNNHSTSEATGLFVGGSWLKKNGDGTTKFRGQQWAAKGRKLLERCVSRLILDDGSFSQHSLTYHRMMLDTIGVAEAWRRYMRESAFSEAFYTKAAAATRWMGAMIDPQSGDGPNLGPNDGSHPYHLDSSAYRDFRPCLQLASLLFISKPALEPGPWDESASWLDIAGDVIAKPWLKDVGSAVFADGGYVVMRNSGGACALLRAPTARFRPGHADALNLDFWWKGKNLLRDGGTYSYSDGALAKALFSTVGHNVQEFDDHDQMPRLGRFLYGGWIRVCGAPTITTTTDGQSWSGSYTDVWRAQHKRTVRLKTDQLSVRDEVQGFKRKAVLRWRLAPGNWTKDETGCASTMGRIRVESSAPVQRMSLESGWESRHYLEKSTVPVLEVEIDQSPAVVTTTFFFT